MVVFGSIVPVSVHSPEEVFLEAVGMTMLGDHFEVVLDGLEHSRDVMHDRRQRADE